VVKGMYKAQIATLIHVFHLTIPEIRELTQYQIQELYFHKQDKNGNIVVPTRIDVSEMLGGFRLAHSLGNISDEDMVSLENSLSEVG